MPQWPHFRCFPKICVHIVISYPTVQRRPLTTGAGMWRGDWFGFGFCAGTRQSKRSGFLGSEKQQQQQNCCIQNVVGFCVLFEGFSWVSVNQLLPSSFCPRPPGSDDDDVGLHVLGCRVDTLGSNYKKVLKVREGGGGGSLWLQYV